jgi:hypothetical protein
MAGDDRHADTLKLIKRKCAESLCLLSLSLMMHDLHVSEENEVTSSSPRRKKRGDTIPRTSAMTAE